MNTPGVSSWPYKEGKASRDNMVEEYQKPKGHGRDVYVTSLDHGEVAHYPLPRGGGGGKRTGPWYIALLMFSA